MEDGGARRAGNEQGGDHRTDQQAESLAWKNRGRRRGEHTLARSLRHLAYYCRNERQGPERHGAMLVEFANQILGLTVGKLVREEQFLKVTDQVPAGFLG